MLVHLGAAARASHAAHHSLRSRPLCLAQLWALLWAAASCTHAAIAAAERSARARWCLCSSRRRGKFKQSAARRNERDTKTCASEKRKAQRKKRKKEPAGRRKTGKGNECRA